MARSRSRWSRRGMGSAYWRDWGIVITFGGVLALCVGVAIMVKMF